MQRRPDPDHEREARHRYSREELARQAGAEGRRMAAVVDRAGALSAEECRALAGVFRQISDSVGQDLAPGWEQAFRYTWPYPQHPPDLYAIDPLSRAAATYGGIVARERAGEVLGAGAPEVGLVERAVVGALLALAAERAGTGGWYMPVPAPVVALLARAWAEVLGPPEEPDPPEEPAPAPAHGARRRMRSHMCREADLLSPEFRRWAEAIRPGWDGDRTAPDVIMHRKLWEWLFIIQALDERGMLRPGRRGLGFGVGTEPLVSYFAGRGCGIVATDLDPGEAEAVGWDQTNQYAGGIEGLNRYGLCEPGAFRSRTSFRVVNMNAIPADLRGFDFNWSSCAFEHLGSIGRGVDFILEQVETLRPGGVGVHTTEFNVASNEATVEEGGTVIFRRRDLEEMARRLRARGHRVDVDFLPGEGAADRHVDAEPYGPVHLKVALAGHVTTSFGLIVERGGLVRRGLARVTRAPAPLRGPAS